MKSAYELAMDKFKDDEPTPKLTAEQREQLAEVDKKYDAKIAERSLFLNKKMLELTAAGQEQEADAVHRQLRDEKVRLNEEREEAKDKVRNGA